jgi:MurNAc alpha-1-phosphate uridylyltransferase
MYRPEFFAGCADGEFPLKPLLLRCMAAERCSAQVYPGRWADVGTPQRLAALNGE